MGGKDGEVVQKEQGWEGRMEKLSKRNRGGREGWGSCPKGTGVGWKDGEVVQKEQRMAGKGGEVVQKEQRMAGKGWEVVPVYTSMNEQDTRS